MKKYFFTFCIVLAAMAAHGQFGKTTWKGTIKGDAAQAAILKFGKDSVALNNTAGGLIELMTYTYKAGILTLKKIKGQSDCDNVIAGKYKLAFSGNTFTVTVVEDKCSDRSSALNNTNWAKQ